MYTFFLICNGYIILPNWPLVNRKSGEKVKIPQKGYKDGRGSRGDLIAEVKTVVPKKLTEEEKELFEQLKSISKFNPRQTYM